MNPHNPPTLSAPADDTGSSGGTEARGALAETKNKIAQSARETAAKIKDATGDATERAKEEAERIATDQKQTAADRIDSYSSAIHDSARALEEKDPNIAWFTHRAADKLQNVADYVRDRDFPALRRDAEDLARRHPAAFFGGMFLAGLVVGNIVKASRRKLAANDEFESESDYEGERSSHEQHEMELPELTDAERSAAGI